MYITDANDLYGYMQVEQVTKYLTWNIYNRIEQAFDTIENLF